MSERVEILKSLSVNLKKYEVKYSYIFEYSPFPDSPLKDKYSFEFKENPRLQTIHFLTSVFAKWLNGSIKVEGFTNNYKWEFRFKKALFFLNNLYSTEKINDLYLSACNYKKTDLDYCNSSIDEKGFLNKLSSVLLSSLKSEDKGNYLYINKETLNKLYDILIGTNEPKGVSKKWFIVIDNIDNRSNLFDRLIWSREDNEDEGAYYFSHKEAIAGYTDDYKQKYSYYYAQIICDLLKGYSDCSPRLTQNENEKRM